MRPDAPPPPRLTPEKVRVGRVLASILAIILTAVSAFSLLLLWHLIRRGRILRESLGPPKRLRLPDVEPTTRPPEPPGREEQAS